MEFERTRFDRLKNSHARVTFQFILTELDLAATFCDIAAGTQDPVTKKRNLGNARRARDAAVHFLDQTRLDAGEREALLEKLKTLEARISKTESLRDKQQTR